MSEKYSHDSYNNNNNNSGVDSLDCEEQDIFPFAQLARPLLASNCSEYAVAHANIDLQPARQLSEVSFLPHILYAMRRLRLTQLLRVQSYAWPYLQQGSDRGAVIVGAPRSGRTLSFVPPLCHLVCHSLMEQRSRRRWELQGPIAIVLAADLGRVQHIGSLCNTMLRKAKNEEWLSLVLTVPSAESCEFFHRWLNGCGCLVATPAQFLWLRSFEALRLAVLRFVAYDDVDLMPAEQLQQVHQHLLVLTKKQRPQLVITSQSYNHKLLHMLREFNAHTMVLFGDILEAALYGGVRIRLSLLKREAKQEELLLLLQQRPPRQLRTVINCQRDEEIGGLVQFLESHGYKCLPYYQTADMDVRDHVHRWMQHTAGEILLCTDDCPELDIRHAHTLIHYSLSNSWSKFKLRHLALADNLRNQFAQSRPDDAVMELGTHKELEQDSLLSMVYLDETNNKQLPRLVDFLDMHQQADERVLQLARQIRDQLEVGKSNEPALCDFLLSLGHCVDKLCTQRHQLLPYDRCLPAWMPVSGDVKLQLVRVYTPIHYCVRLLEHLPPGGNWQAITNSAALQMKLQLLQAQGCLRLWPPKAKDICIYQSDCGYERVRILHVAPIDRVNLSRIDVAVEVQAMDVDTRQIKTTSGKLYICPEEFVNAPPLAIDLRILGMVPYTGERSWHEEDAIQCAQWLNAIPKPNFLQATIVQSLFHTIFVNNLAATSYAPSLQLHVRRFDMCQQLTSSKLAKKCEQTIQKLMKYLREDGKLTELSIEETVRCDQSIDQAYENQQCEETKFLSEEPLDKQGHEEQQFREQQLQAEQQKLRSSRGRLSLFAKMAKQLGRENQLHLETKQLQQMNETQLNLDDKTREDNEPQSNLAALYNCIMNCTLLELQGQQSTIDNCKDPEALLKQLIESDINEKQYKPTIFEPQTPKTKTRDLSIIDKSSDIQYRTETPANVVRPDVIYYQTTCTLELQVVLPEDKMQYEADLLNERCISFCTLLETLEAIRYQFIINTHCPYQSLKHHMQGRTVYLSVLKALAITYPLEFSFYKFMKPQHEKLNTLEDERRERLADFETYLVQKGYIQGRLSMYNNDDQDESSDDQAEEPVYPHRAERVERAVDRAQFIRD